MIIDYLEFSGLGTELTSAPELHQTVLDFLDHLEIILFLQSQCQRNVVIHFTVVLNWTWTFVMIV